MISKQNNNIHWLQFEHLSRFPGLKHFISTRKGGISPQPTKGLNLGFGLDEPLNVVTNRQLLAEALGFKAEQYVFQEQVHSCTVKIIGKEHAGAGWNDNESRIPESDAMVSQQTGLCLMAMAADCVPILLFDPRTRTIAAIHAGWKGTVGKIASHTVQVMIDAFGVKPTDVHAGIGPSISAQNYEVGETVVSEAKKNFSSTDRMIYENPQTHKPHFDIWQANKEALLEAGLANKNIETAALCTYNHPDLFFSYRKELGQTGRFCGGIMLE